MEIKWIPEDKSWEGFILFDDLSYPKKQRLKVKHGLKVTQKGEFTVENDDNLFLLGAAFFELSNEVIKEMSMKHLDSGVVVKSLEELCRYAEGEMLMIAFGRTVMGGLALGKDLNSKLRPKPKLSIKG